MLVTLFGASGKTGRHALKALLAAGHSVRVLVRDKSKLEPGAYQINLGSLDDPQAVAAALAGAQAAVFAAGPVKGQDPDLPWKAAENVTAAMREQGISRLVWLLGAAVKDSRDGKDPIRPLMRGLMRLLAPSVLSASEKAYRIIVESGLDYTVVRPPILGGDEAGTGLRSSWQPPKPVAISRSDLGTFMAACVEGTLAGQWSRASPFVEPIS